jgi:platelet-activating factor acetylhydrolase
MDPWLEPFPTPGPCLLRDSSQSTSGVIPNLLVMSSEGFTLWGEHFDRLEGLVRSWGRSGSDIGPSKHGTHLTIPTALHVNFSDFPLFLPRMPRDRQGNARKLLSTMHQVSSSFLEDELGCAGEEGSGLLGELQNEGRLRRMEIELIPSKAAVDEKGTLSWKGRKLKGITGDVILHDL